MVTSLRRLLACAATAATVASDVATSCAEDQPACCCSGSVGANDPRGRSDYGTRCARWDAVDEAPWCVVDSSACGGSTFESSTGHYWAHKPCNGKGDAFKPASEDPKQPPPKAKAALHGGMVDQWRLCGADSGAPPSWQGTDYNADGVAYKFALYSATVVDGLSKKEVTWLGDVARETGGAFDVKAKRYIRAAVHANLAEHTFESTYPEEEAKVSMYGVLKLHKGAVAVLYGKGNAKSLVCTVDGVETAGLLSRVFQQSDLAATVGYLYCPIPESMDAVDKGKYELTISHKTVTSFKLKSTGVCRRKVKKHRLTWCTNSIELMDRYDCTSAAKVAQAVRYYIAMGVDHVVLYDRWNVFDNLLKSFVDAGQLTLVNWPPFYKIMTRWGRSTEGFGMPGYDKYLIAADKAGKDFDGNLLLYGDQINVQLNCAMHYGAATDYSIFSDFDEFPVLHPRADEFKPGPQKSTEQVEKAWTLGIASNKGPANIADWLDKQDPKYDSFNFCAGMMVGPRPNYGPDGKVVDGTIYNDPKSANVIDYDYRSSRCYKRGQTMDKWIARPEVVMEPSIHTMEQSWSTKRRWYKFPERPRMLMVPTGVAHFRHLKRWISMNFDGKTKKWSPLNPSTGISVTKDRLDWAVPLLQPWFQENNHYSKAEGRCVFGAGESGSPENYKAIVI